MNLRWLVWLLSALWAVSGYAREGTLDPGLVNPGYHAQPEWFKTSFLDITTDIAEAQQQGKHLVLFFHQDGCPYCKKLLEDNLRQGEIVSKMRQHFEVVALNIWGEREVTVQGNTLSEKDFAAQLKVMYTPTLLFLDASGKAALRLNGYYPPEKFNPALDYVLQRHNTLETFSAYLARTTAKPASGTLQRALETSPAPYNFAQASSPDKPYWLLIFAQPQCPDCDELLTGILQRANSRSLLQAFAVSVLDISSNELITDLTGNSVTLRDFAAAQRIQYVPSLVLLDASGKEVFRLEAYLKAFHIQSALDYVASGSYLSQPNFQRYIEARAAALRAQGVVVDIMQ